MILELMIHLVFAHKTARDIKTPIGRIKIFGKIARINEASQHIRTYEATRTYVKDDTYVRVNKRGISSVLEENYHRMKMRLPQHGNGITIGWK